MKKLHLIAIGIVLALSITIFLTPEREFKKIKNESIEWIAKENDIPPFAAKFIINTSVGRKIAFWLYKKKSNNKKK